MKYLLDLYLHMLLKHGLLSKTNEQRVSLFERKVFPCIFGVKKENKTWQKGYNYELYKIFNEPNIVNYIQVKRLAWAGHLMHMNNERSLKKIFNTKPDGVRRAERPKLRWEDENIRGQELEGRPPQRRMGKASKKGQAHQGLSNQ